MLMIRLDKRYGWWSFCELLVAGCIVVSVSVADGPLGTDDLPALTSQNPGVALVYQVNPRVESETTHDDGMGGMTGDHGTIAELRQITESFVTIAPST